MCEAGDFPTAPSAYGLNGPTAPPPEHLATTATVVSDGLNCFPAVTKAGCRHELEVVGKTSMPCFKWVNTALG